MASGQYFVLTYMVIDYSEFASGCYDFLRRVRNLFIILPYLHGNCEYCQILDLRYQGKAANN